MYSKAAAKGIVSMALLQEFHLMCSVQRRINSGLNLFAGDANEGNRDVGWVPGQGWERYGIQLC